MSGCAVSSDTMKPDLVDRHLIAERLGVSLEAVSKWKVRGLLPPPDYPDLRNPIWRWTTIRDWAKRTGRLAA